MNDLSSLHLEKWETLLKLLQGNEKLGVTLSGGVDSALVCAAAVAALGVGRVKAYSIQSSMETPQEMEDARRITDQLGVEHYIIKFDEMEIEEIRSNPIDRCYFCKLARMKKILEHATSVGMHQLVDGSNFDDRDDYRPGLKALAELGVKSPLGDAGITKREVRQLARWQGLFVWDKPSNPCLASRFPYGVEISHQRIQQVACAEMALKSIGFDELRVRYHECVARLEVPTSLFEKVLEQRTQIVEKIKACGFLYVSLDLQGFRSGSMNEGL
ncbi:MAG: ATP-dependent sacrificial sulfur transferase LarE [Anaerolineaceae bacterium]|nr:ATP-dependent sacrificial sulfur transferase LarE [Anaerolineaceae bacterium]